MPTRRFLVGILCLSLGCRLLADDQPKPSPEANYDKALQAELLAILENDQGGRSQIDRVKKEHGLNSPEMQTLWKTINERDAADLAKIKAILDTRGWVGPNVVGPKANSALFFVIQHADTATQQKYLPLMRTAVKEKKAFPGQLALLEDRVALAEGRLQTYGSQLRSDKDGHYFLSPLVDPDHVDERRAAVGLGTMAENLQRFNLPWDVEAYKQRLPEYVKLQWGCVPAAGGFDLPVQNELLALLNEFSTEFTQLEVVQKKHGDNSPESQALTKSFANARASRLTKVTTLIDHRGWISPGEVDGNACQALWLVFSNADLATRQHYLPLMRAAAKENRADKAELAQLEDQTALDEGRRQIYGSQFGLDQKTGQSYVRPIDDPDHVDERRATMGLEPMAESVKRQGITWDLAAHKLQNPILEVPTGAIPPANAAVEKTPAKESSK